jgi:hypothetical protein
MKMEIPFVFVGVLTRRHVSSVKREFPFKATWHIERNNESKALHFCRFLSTDKSTPAEGKLEVPCPGPGNLSEGLEHRKRVVFMHFFFG